MSRRPRSAGSLPFLHRFLVHFAWPREDHLPTPIGVTAFSIEDALEIIREDWHHDGVPTPTGFDEDVDLSLVPRTFWKAAVGPTNVRGVWYPFRTIE